MILFSHYEINIVFTEILLYQTGSGAHPASYPVGIRDSFPGGKAVRV